MCFVLIIIKSPITFPLLQIHIITHVRLIKAEHAGVMCPIAEDRINKVRRRSSKLYGVNELKVAIRSVMELICIMEQNIA